MKSKPLATLLTWVTSLLVPLALILLGVRLLMTPLFLELEYRMPGFPPDGYGFGLADRLRWSKPSVEFLLNGEGIDFLADLKFANGQPVYNDRELSHMLDVKNVVQMFLKAWYVDLAGLVLLGLWAWRGDWWRSYVLGWKNGGFLTVFLLAGLAIFALTSFWQFFTWFHSLFFAGDTWLFEYSDTLIRLFPIRFWMDVVLYIGAFSILTGLGLGFGLKPSRK